MANVPGIINRIDAALRKTAPPQRTVYKRIVTRTGGDSLLGRGMTVTTADTILDPQPLYQRVELTQIGPTIPVERFVNTAGTNAPVATEYGMIVSVSAMSEQEIQNKDLLLVFKDTDGTEESFRITDYDPVGMSAQAVMYQLFIRSTKQQ